MACECIRKFEAKLRENTGDPEADVKVNFVMVKKSGTITPEEFIPIHMSYRPKKKDGTFGKTKNMCGKGAYCPLCGKKL
jgi:hypothetical protein